MSKEIEIIRQAMESKRQEIDTITRNQQLENGRKAEEISNEREKRRQEIVNNSAKNQKKFQDAGIINLLEDIKDSGLLRYKLSDKNKSEYYFTDTGIYKNTLFGGRKFISYQKEKVHCEPPHIEWNGIGEMDFHDHSQISLVFNYKSWPASGKYDDSPGGCRYDSISFCIKEDEIHIDDKKISEIPDISNYLAEKISKTIN